MRGLGRAQILAVGALWASLALWVGWISLIQPAMVSRAEVLRSPYLVAPLCLIAAVGVGRLAAPRVLAGLALATAAALYLGAVWTLAPGAAPLGYANANAALAIQVIGLSGIAGVRGELRWRLGLAAAAMLAFAGVLANSSRAAIPLAIVVLALTIWVLWRTPVRAAPVACVAFVLVAATAGVFWRLVAQVSSQEASARPDWTRLVADPTRWQLWQDAWDLWRSSAETGHGPGSFEAFSPLARDPDTAAAHSILLQVGAEAGWVGVALLAVIWLAGLLVAASSPGRTAIPAIAAWSALALHSLVDHLVDFAPVMIAAGLVLGSAAGADRSSAERALRRVRYRPG